MKKEIKRLYHSLFGHDRCFTWQKREKVGGRTVYSDLACSCGSRQQTTWHKKEGGKGGYKPVRAFDTSPFPLFHWRNRPLHE